MGGMMGPIRGSSDPLALVSREGGSKLGEGTPYVPSRRDVRMSSQLAMPARVRR
jgi:hypothetical protein